MNPHVSGLIYANLKKSENEIRTYISFNNGNSFSPITFNDDCSLCGGKFYGVEFDLNCSADSIKNNFPEPWVMMFKGIYYGKCRYTNKIFFTFNGNNRFYMSSTIEKIIFLKNVGLVFSKEIGTGKIWYSFDERNNNYKKDIGIDDVIDMIQLGFPNNRVVAVLNYNKLKNTYSLVSFDFSKIIKCKADDFETYYLPRNYGKCFQGKEVYYMKIKPSTMCYDTKSAALPTFKSCPCSVLDFHWYDHGHYSLPNYYLEDKLCVLDPHSNYKEPVKTCRDGGTPFAKLDKDVCYSRPVFSDENPNYSDYCISESNQFSNILFIFFPNYLNEYRLDYKGNYLPSSYIQKQFIETNIIKDEFPRSYDIKDKTIFFYHDHMIFRIREQKGNFTSNEISLYHLKEDIVSIGYEYTNSILFFLDKKNRLFALSTKSNYIKLLSSDVVSFQLHSSTL
ncbi:hypothetical protein RF11_15882 [Thelohanellus kitauei]|uniref:Sortilin C-terminal domain-containing protein n=1 Tax=Thelohanellus kitauei TaxID=669202 RepID=A0A0C2MSN5_THEKT|nr:hypothetical protein RF11_15882 [Thelohanellus kitauei]